MRRLAGFIVLLVCAGCTTTPADLRASDPSVRIPAIKKSVSKKDQTQEAKMVHDLRSDDPAMRFYAIQGLYRLTGETFGYRYYDDEPTRQKAVEKWEKWLHESKMS